MPRNPLSKPLHKLRDTAKGAISDPKGTADKVVEQARGAAALGKMVAEGVAGEVANRARRRRGSDAPRAASPRLHPAPATPAEGPPTKKQGDPVAATATKSPPGRGAPSPAEVAKKAAKKAPAQKSTAKKTGAKKAGTKAPAKKASAKKTAAKKTAAKKTAAKKAPAKKAPAKKTAAKKAPAKKADSGPPGDKLPPRRPAEPEKPADPPPHEPNPEATD